MSQALDLIPRSREEERETETERERERSESSLIFPPYKDAARGAILEAESNPYQTPNLPAP
jgi:hypothetical protein